jgi:hypothetical protein
VKVRERAARVDEPSAPAEVERQLPDIYANFASQSMNWVAMLALATRCGWLCYRRLRSRSGNALAISLGAAVGVFLLLSKFLNSAASSTPTLTLDIPADFAHESVVLITDPSVTSAVVWSGGDWPFSVKQGHIAVPKSGIVRVKSLGIIDSHVVDAVLSDGRIGRAFTVAEIGSARAASFNFVEEDERKEPAMDVANSPKFSAYIRERERER